MELAGSVRVRLATREFGVKSVVAPVQGAVLLSTVKTVAVASLSTIRQHRRSLFALVLLALLEPNANFAISRWATVLYIMSPLAASMVSLCGPRLLLMR